MIDLHIHILPGLDDGPTNLGEAVEMCCICFEEGINTLVATPHIIREVYENRREDILNAVETLQRTLDQKEIPIRILPGADVQLDFDLVDRLDRKELCTINDGNKYLLLEIPETLAGLDLTRSISILKKKGIHPIVSHPERVAHFRENPEAIYSLVHSDVLMQITARSLLGGFGREVKWFTERLLKSRLVHILASDAHSPAGRAPGLRSALQRASELLGEEEALKLVEGNPKAILQGERFKLPQPLPWKKTKTAWWRLGL